MGFASSYSAKLRDPRWQKKRLEVLSEAKFTCQDCGATDKELHIHHAYYIRGKEPWQYPGTLLTVLCKDCHEIAEVDRQNILDMYFQLNHAAREEVNSLVSWYCGQIDHDECYGTDEYRASVVALRSAIDRWFAASKADDES